MNRTPRPGTESLGILCAWALFVSSCAPVPAPQTQGAPPAAPASPVYSPPKEERPAPRSEPQRITSEPTIEVGIGFDLDSLTVEPLKNVRLRRVMPGYEDPLGDSRDPIRVMPGSVGFRVEGRLAGGGALAVTLTAAETLWISAPDRSDAVPEPSSRWAGKTWRGDLKIFIGPRGRLTLVTRLPLETYLLGVVPGEIGGLAQDLVEAGRAQAIAARSYTLFYRGRRGAEGFDLFGSVEDQVYGPIESERPLATRCVETTRGSVALSDGFPIRANYCSTCGGITADVWEGWATDPLSYLVSHRDRGNERDHCSASPHHRWREEWSAADFMANLSKYVPAEGIALPAGGLGELLDVQVVERSHSGRVWRLAIRTTTGNIEIPAYSLRRVLRRPPARVQILRSNLFKMDVLREPVTRKARAVVASGAGSGHGVGLCQTGAIGMARDGFSADRIVTHYYPGIDLRRLY